MDDEERNRRVVVVRRDDCGHGKSAIATIKALADRLGIVVAVDDVVVWTEEEARAHRCIGSPTILIDGRDVEPAARGVSSFGIT